jgi:hypothetical protein
MVVQVISVKEVKIPATGITSRMVDCPFCGISLTFCSSPIHMCGYCKNPLINLVTLRINLIYRAAYHFEALDLRGQSIKK